MAMTAVVTIASLAIAGCRDEKRAASPRATHPAAAPQGSGGEVALNDESTTVRWLGDGNIVALTALLNSRQVAAADWELQHWGSDTTRALAEWLAQEPFGKAWMIQVKVTAKSPDLLDAAAYDAHCKAEG